MLFLNVLLGDNGKFLEWQKVLKILTMTNVSIMRLSPDGIMVLSQSGVHSQLELHPVRLFLNYNPNHNW